MTNKKQKNPFQDTLNLPTTDFSIRANAATKEAEILKGWEEGCLWEKSWSCNNGEKKFVLHDGPPYANGHIHIGHVLNKVLKDIVSKYYRMAGYHVPITPGWDCHGLPIELKVAAESKDRAEISRSQFKKLCRTYASKWIKVQKEEFKNLGVMMNWGQPYITMNPSYEADILRAFSKFIDGGYIDRKGKTVPWCSSCQTVLAAAEIEYKERKDPSIYVLFPFAQDVAKKIFPNVLEKQPNLKTNMLIWTTTPWTLPLNRAVVVRPNTIYVLLQGKDDQAFVIAKELVEKICLALGLNACPEEPAEGLASRRILAEFDSSIFDGQKVGHPFVEGLQVPIILDESVLLDEGSACVHSAPGCGPEDYFLGVKNGLEIFSPLSADGKYTQGIQPKELEGMSIGDGQIWVIKKLHALGRLAHKTSLRHSYPHCWRCHNGLMFRATEQWFCDLQKNDLVKDTLKEIEKINFVPDWGKSRLNAFVSNRTEWCISRQRVWGVPIPALLCSECEHVYLRADFVGKIAQQVEKDGIEFWDEITTEKMVENKFLPKDFKCEKCGNSELSKFKKETDILDVWFDSGVSSFAVLAKDKKNLGIPADMYLEGSDQHRGWFQSSLLSSMILNGKTCAKTILTHGFVVDKKGHKMSKSQGNVVAPSDVINKYSRDVLRLWVASSDYQNDISISETILKNVSEVYRKIRNTCRFLISNLYDFDIKKDAVSFDDILFVDQYALAHLHQINNRVLDGYKENNFAAVFHTLNNYCANDLSSLYFDVCKDRLYVEKADGILRRSAQTAMYHILDTLVRLMAPMLSFLAEEVSDFYQKDKDESIHLQKFLEVENIWDYLGKKTIPEYAIAAQRGLAVATAQSASYAVRMQGIFNILHGMREVVLKAIEQKREQGVVKHSLEAKVTLYLDKKCDEKKLIDDFLNDFSRHGDPVHGTISNNRFFKDWFIVSQFEFAKSEKGLQKTTIDWVYVDVKHADGEKCPRCWQWEVTDHAEKLCKRCALVLNK